MLVQLFLLVFRSMFTSPPSILRRSRKQPLVDTNPNINIHPVQELTFSPSAFLNTPSSRIDLLTSTPASRNLFTGDQTPTVSRVSFSTCVKSSERKRKSLFGRNENASKKQFVSTTPRTPTPLKGTPKSDRACTKNPTFDEITDILKSKTMTTPDHDYAKYSSETRNGDETKSLGKESLRRTLFETPCQNNVLKSCGVNLFSDKSGLNVFSEKELNAIEQMSTCFTPRKQRNNNFVNNSSSTPCILKPKDLTNNFIQPQQQIKILPVVGKPMKLPIRKLPMKSTRFSCNTSQFLQLTDAFKTVAYGQTNDQKFLTEQAKLIMKEINHVHLEF